MDSIDIFKQTQMKMSMHKHGFHLTHQVPLPNASINTVPEEPKPKSHPIRNTLLGLGAGAAALGGGYLADKNFNHGQILESLRQAGSSVFPSLRTMPERQGLMEQGLDKYNPDNASHVFSTDGLQPGIKEQTYNNLMNSIGGKWTAGEMVGLPAVSGLVNHYATKLPALSHVKGPLAGLSRGLGVLSGGTTGWDTGTQPLNVEAWNEPEAKWWNPAYLAQKATENQPIDPALARDHTGAMFGAVNAIASGVNPMAGGLGSTVQNLTTKLMQSKLRAQAVNHDSYSTYGDMMENFYHSALKGNPEAKRFLAAMQDKSFAPNANLFPAQPKEWYNPTTWGNNADPSAKYPALMNLKDRVTMLLNK